MYDFYKNSIKIVTIVSLLKLSMQDHCKMNDGWCSFISVRTTESSKFFQPMYDDPSIVHRIDFKNTSMTVLTREICDAFPNLREMYIVGAKLQRIQPDALTQCENLLLFDIYGNSVKELDNSLFSHSPDLRHIKLSSNQFYHIDTRVFQYSRKLEFLHIELNFLIEFDFKNIPKLSLMKEIHLNRNFILALDDNEVIEKFPKLEKIYIENNLFKCDDLRKMIKTFKRNNIALGYWNLTSNSAHPTMKIDGIECLNRNEYLDVVLGYIKGLNGTTTNTSEFLFGIIEAELKPKNFMVLAVFHIIATVLISFCVGLILFHGYYWHGIVNHFLDENGEYYYYNNYQLQARTEQNTQ